MKDKEKETDAAVSSFTDNCSYKKTLEQALNCQYRLQKPLVCSSVVFLFTLWTTIHWI